MQTFSFWQKWLFYSSLFFGLFGIVVATAGDTPLFALWRANAARVFFDSTAFPEDANRFRLFLFGPIGGTIAGSYVLQAWIAHVPFKRKELWAWNASVVSLLAWFCIDSAVSTFHGAFFNVYLINLAALVVMGIPLAATRNEFKRA